MSQGHKNVYQCNQCSGRIVTLDIDEGVTPFMVPCYATAGCKGMMQSSFYVCNQAQPHTHEWYQPKSTEGFSEWAVDHIKKGGLVLRTNDGVDLWRVGNFESAVVHTAKNNGASVEMKYKEVFCLITFDGEDMYVVLAKEIKDPKMAEVFLPYVDDTTYYGVTCYVTNYPNSDPIPDIALTLRRNVEEILGSIERMQEQKDKAREAREIWETPGIEIAPPGLTIESWKLPEATWRFKFIEKDESRTIIFRVLQGQHTWTDLFITQLNVDLSCKWHLTYSLMDEGGQTKERSADTLELCIKDVVEFLRSGGEITYEAAIYDLEKFLELNK